jgi:hypothetical protein
MKLNTLLTMFDQANAEYEVGLKAAVKHVFRKLFGFNG